VRQLATEYAKRGAFSERTNEMAAVAHPVGMEVVTARCRNSAEEWRRQKEINRRAKEVIQARQKKAEEDVARAAHNGEVVRQSAARSAEKAEKKRQRQAEKNKQRRKKKKMRKILKEWEEEAREDEWARQSYAVVEEGAVVHGGCTMVDEEDEDAGDAGNACDTTRSCRQCGHGGGFSSGAAGAHR